MTKSRISDDADIDLSTEITIGGLTLAVMGVIHSVVFYYPFDINIFDHIGASDFIVLALKNPFAILATVFWSLSVFATTHRYQVPRCLISRTTYLISIVAFGAVSSFFFSYIEARQVLSGNGRFFNASPCTIALKDGGGNREFTNITPLGTVGDYYVLYFYDKESTFFYNKRVVDSVSCARR